MVALIGVGILAVLYPVLDDRTQHPLAVFVLPILVVAALGTWMQTVVVGALASMFATAEGIGGPLNASSVVARLTIVGSCWLVGVAVAAERTRRDRLITEATSRMVRVSTALHVGKLGTWQWDRRTGEVDWDAHVHALFGVDESEYDGTFEGWVERIHVDDRAHVLGVLEAGLDGGGSFEFDHRCVWPDGSQHWIHGVGEVVIVDGSAIGATGLALDIDDRMRLLNVERRAVERSEFLERTNRVLFDSLDLTEVVERIAAAAVPELADWCSLIVTIDQPVDDPQITVAHVDAGMVEWAHRLQAEFPYDVHAPNGVPNAIRTGSIEYVPVIDASVLDALSLDPAVREIVEVLDLRSSIVVPVQGGLGMLGALQLVRTSARASFSEDDVELAVELARPIGAALNNTVLFARQQSAQLALDGLQQLTARLVDLSGVAEIADVVARFGTDLLKANTALLYLTDDSGVLHLHAQSGHSPEQLAGRARLGPDDAAPIPDALRADGLVVLSNKQDITARYPHMSGAADDTAIIAAVLSRRDRVIGGLSFGWRRPHVISETDKTLVRNIAGRCASALERARLSEQQRAIAHTLQRSLIPSELATTSWFDVEGRYWPGVEGTEVGGDFYDLFHISDRRWALIIGDVCGKGVEAASLTAVARHTARSAARHVDTPTAVLDAVHRAIADYDGDNYCTVCFAFLEQSDDATTVDIALGGHPQPLLRRGNGTVELLGLPGTLLGLIEPRTSATRTTLHCGDTLVLYTDGVTDAAGELEVTIDELSATVATADPEPAHIASAVETLLRRRRPNGVTDDTALLILQVTQDNSAASCGDLRRT